MHDPVSLTEPFGPVIHRYTRAQALADGVLIDATETARQAGIGFPLAVTQTVWSEWIVPRESDRVHGQSESGRLWDLVWMLRMAIAGTPAGASHLEYEVLFQRAGRSETVRLKAICGPGDHGEPVLTVMLPNED